MAKKRSRFERNIRVTHGPKIQRKKRESKGSNFSILKSKPPIQNYLSDISDEWRFNQYERGSPDKKVYRVKEQKITQLFDKFGNHDIEVGIDAVDEEGYLTITFLANGPGCKQKMGKRKIDYLNKEKEKEDRKDERTKIQASQQSQLIDQRKSGKAPKNFESAGNDTMGGGFSLEAFGPK